MKYLVAAAAVAAVGASVCVPAMAFDGCKVILCLAGAWQQIGECVPDVRKALTCMARGRCWPTCNDAPNVSLSYTIPTACPAQYGLYELDACGRQVLTGCTKTGVISVAHDGNPAWTRVWFNTGTVDNGAVIEYSEAARAALGTAIDPTFDLDYQAWVATQPPAQPPLTCYDQGGGH